MMDAGVAGDPVSGPRPRGVDPKRGKIIGPDHSANRRPGSTGRVREAAASFWLNLLFENTTRWPWVVRAVKPFFTFFAWHCSPTLRDGPTANARWLLGPGSTTRQHRALAKAVVRDFYDFVCEIGHTTQLPPRQLLDRIEAVEGHERYLAARGRKKGAIVVTAHLGSFELGVAALADLERHIHVVYHRDAFDRFERLRAVQRRHLGVHEANTEQGLAMWARLRDALRDDHVVLVQGDRILPGQTGVRVPFLGGHVMMPTGPVKLALASGAPMIPTVSVKSRSGQVRIVMDEPIDVEPQDGKTDHTHPAMVRLASFFERFVSRYPDQWHVLHRAWCEDQTDPT